MPAYHPEWLVTFWLTTPGLKLLDPHLTLIILAAFITLLIYKRKKNKAKLVDSSEERFQLLLNQKKLIEVELKELVNQLQSNDISEEQFSVKKQALEKHLEKTMNELKQFTL